MKRKKNSDFALLSLVISTILFFACSRDEQIQNQKVDSTEKLLTFKTFDPNQYETSRFYIVAWDEWGRKKKQCKGWGLCNADWWGDDGEKKYQFPLQFDSASNQYYLDILLAETMPTPIPEELKMLPIDEDIVLSKIPEFNNNLTLKAGEYSFDITLGKYGGYHIPLN